MRFVCTQMARPAAWALRLHHMRPSALKRVQRCSAELHATCWQGDLAPEPLSAIVVLAGGLAADGRVPEVGKRRLQAAAQLHQESAAAGQVCPIVCSGGGSPHVPAVVNDCGQVTHESSAYCDYLSSQCGIKQRHLLKETASYDTIGNAYFFLLIHALPAKWRHIAMVTSAFHMPRSRAIVKHCAQLAYASAGLQQPRLSFISASDDGVFAHDALEARRQREHQSLQMWKDNAAKLNSLTELHTWLHATHLCYSVQRQADFGRRRADDVTDAALNTY